VAQFLTLPGVRIQEVLLSSPPIIGVSTSTAAFIGNAPTPTSDAPTTFTQYPDLERLVTSADQFTNDYIGIPTDPTKPFTIRSTPLSRAVYGFFANGGTACYVVNIKALSVAQALALLEAHHDISIVAAPGRNDNATYAALQTHAENMQDRFAILDPPALTTTPGSLLKPINSQYAAIYYPRVLVGPQLKNPNDPATPHTTDDPLSEAVTPVGHIAGVYARVDANRGVFKAPANETMLGVLGVE
jgi:phage tail sheath protein FI